jgi:hypothetical protein
MGISPRFGYYRLASEQIGNLDLSRYLVGLQADRVRAALAAPDDIEAASNRLDADAQQLVIAMHNGLVFAEAVQAYVKDERLAEALAALAREFPHLKDMRDVISHLVEYILDAGHLQPEGRSKRRGEVAAGSSSWRMSVDGDVRLAFGPFYLDVLAAATKVADVLDLAAEVWQRGLERGVDGLGAVEGA